MAVVIWQLFVMLSVVISYIAKGRKFAFWICMAWTAWTLIAVFMLPLVLVQLLFCWGTYVICRWIENLWTGSRTRDHTIVELRRKVEEVVKGDVSRAQIAAIREAAEKAPDSLLCIEGKDHYTILKQAFAQSEHRVCILSGWIGSPLIDPNIQELIRDATARGVRLYFGFGWQSSDGHQLSKTARQAISFMNNIGNLFLAQFANHEKILVVDQAYCVIGSNNWLSNASFKNNERSFLMRDSKLATNEGDRVQKLVESNLRI